MACKERVRYNMAPQNESLSLQIYPFLIGSPGLLSRMFYALKIQAHVFRL